MDGSLFSSYSTHHFLTVLWVPPVLQRIREARQGAAKFLFEGYYGDCHWAFWMWQCSNSWGVWRVLWRSFPSLGILLVCMSLNGSASSSLWLLAAHSSTLPLYLLLGSPVSTVLLAISIWYTETSPGFALLTLDTQTIPVQSHLCLGGGGVRSSPSP